MNSKPRRKKMQNICLSVVRTVTWIVCVYSVDDVVDESDDNEEADADTENDTENDDDDKDLLAAVTLSTHTHMPYFTWQHYKCVLFRVQNVKQIFSVWRML